MLMMLGPVSFQVAPFNATEVGHSHESAWVEKAVLGAMPPVEYVGEGPETWTIRAKLFPRRFGGMSGLVLLKEARRAGLPQYMMRGDGGMLGWVVIERVTERSTYLDKGGVGQVIEIDISVRRCAAPAAASFFSIMEAVFR